MAETITLKQVYRELKGIKEKMATKAEVKSLRESMEILTNPDTLRQIAGSMADIQQGKTKAIRSVRDLLI